MKNIVSAMAVACCAALTGCAPAPVVLNYAPGSTLTVQGIEKVGDFEYLPGKSGKVKPNQIRNTAIGNIVLEKPIDEYFHQAFFTESRFVGININGKQPVVHGTIQEFLIDDLGYSVDWTLNVKYVVDSVNSTTPCYEQVKNFSKHTAKFANVFGTLNEVMRLNIEEVFKDPAFVTCISSEQVASAATSSMSDSAIASNPGSATTSTPTPIPQQENPTPSTENARSKTNGGRPLSYIGVH